MVPAWLLALVVFLVVCVIGWYTIYSYHDGVPEGFENGGLESPASGPPLAPKVPEASKDPKSPPIQDTEYTSLAKQASSNSPTVLNSSMVPLLQSVIQQLDKGMNIPVIGAGGQDHPPTPSYTPSQQVLPPHKTPMTQPQALTATSTTDGFTGVANIQADAILTPSVRQMIRDDVKKAVKDELTTIQNEYEIVYEKQ